MKGQIVILAIATMVLAAGANAGTYSGGAGTAANPYQIATAADLIALGQNTDNYGMAFVLTRDLDLSGHVFPQAVISPFVYNAEEDSYNGQDFVGRFNGNGHTISHLTIVAKAPNVGYLGLFGELGASAAAENLRLEGVSISYVDNSCYVGGLCGSNFGLIRRCSAKGAVNGSMYIGGICGVNSGILRECESGITVFGQGCLGGVTGSNVTAGTLAFCCATGVVNGMDNSFAMGGLCGENAGSISNSYARGMVTCGEEAEHFGGLLGHNIRGTVTDCYSTGAVITGQDYSFAGGLCGLNSLGTIRDCFWDTQTSYWTWSDGGTGKTTAEMQTVSTYIAAGWDFTLDRDPADWVMIGHEYPQLAWQVCTVPDVAGMMQRIATSAIENAGLIVGRIKIQFTLDHPNNTVISQSLTAGSRVSIWTEVDLVIAHNPLAGQGTEAAPYQIATVADWQLLVNNGVLWSYHFILVADLDFQWAVLTPIAPDKDSYTNGFQGTAFTGDFNGNGHTILRAVVYEPDNECVGLFGCLGAGGKIHDLVVTSEMITGRTSVGGLVGLINGGGLESCSMESNCTVNGRDKVGGLAGETDESSQIESCHVSSFVQGNEAIGGMVGWNLGSITSCSTESVGVVGQVLNSTVDRTIGGLVGYNWGPLTSCTVTGNTAGSFSVGGLAGHNRHGTLQFCSSEGHVAGSHEETGGLVGFHDYGYIGQCYSLCTVEGVDSVGGLVGRNGGQIGLSYAMGPVTGSGGGSGVGGLVGSNTHGESATYGSIDECYAIGAVTLTGNGSCGGGLVGNNSQGTTIRVCYAVGKVAGSGDCIGGLVGLNNGNLQYSFWDTAASGQENSGCGWGGIGFASIEMKTKVFYESNGWNFDNPIGWRIMDKQTYPFLQLETETKPGSPDLNGDGRVNLADFVLFAEQWMR